MANKSHEFFVCRWCVIAAYRSAAAAAVAVLCPPRRHCLHATQSARELMRDGRRWRCSEWMWTGRCATARRETDGSTDMIDDAFTDCVCVCVWWCDRWRLCRSQQVRYPKRPLAMQHAISDPLFSLFMQSYINIEMSVVCRCRCC